MDLVAFATSTKENTLRKGCEASNHRHRVLRASHRLALALIFVSAAALYGEACVAEHKVPPVYPMAAKALHLGGTVRVNVTINAAGSVTKAEAKGANRLLSDAAEQAVRKWKFAAANSETAEEVEVVFKINE